MATSPIAASGSASQLDVVLTQLAYMQKGQDEIKATLEKVDHRLRSVEDDRLRAWTIIGFVGVLGLGTVAAFVKWLLTTH